MKAKIIIVYNQSNTLAGSIYTDMRAWLENQGMTIASYHSHSCKTGEADPSAIFAVSLGGDGTFLSCARLVSSNPIPILPIHLGTFGFITEVTQEEWPETLSAWIEGKLKVEERMVLDVAVHRGKTGISRFTAINDAVVSSGSISKIVRLSLNLGGFDAGRFRGDGLILSTPTGSTAYSLAAGGPIMVPPMSAMVLTPLCPFSLNWRPMVIPDRDAVAIRIDSDQRADLLLTVDGQQIETLDEGDLVHMRGRRGGVKIIKSDRRGFYEVVRSKLGWSGGPHA